MSRAKANTSVALKLDDQTLAGGLVAGNRFLSHDQLATRGRQVASGLHDLGVWQGDQVALLLRNGLTLFEATAGSTLLGASPVPLNWHLSAEEIAYILDDCGAKVLIAHADLLTESVLAVCGNVEVIAVQTPEEVVRTYGLKPELAQVPAGLPEWAMWRDTYPEWQESPRIVSGPMFYTSGTTGRPKGVKRKSAPPEVIAAIGERTNLAWGFGDGPIRSVMTGPMYHSAPNAYGLQVMRSGGLLVLQPRFEAEELLSLIESYAITHLHMVPTMFVRMLGLDEATRSRYDTSSLRHVSHGSAPCPEDVKRQMIDWWGPVINEYYAMTEIGIATCSSSDEWLANPGTVGRAALGVELRIVDEQGKTCAPGQAGEILVRSETTTRFSYHRAEEKTQAVRQGDFVATGDVGYLNEDGFLYISDRITDMVISGGVNIYPAEIEKVLVMLPGVKDCAVFGIPDKEFGERLVAFVETPEPMKSEDVIRQLRAQLAGYKVPREIVFTRSLPREDSGKIRKRLIRDKHLQDLAGSNAKS